MHALSNNKIKELADKWLNGTITAEEQAVLDKWYNQPPDERLFWPESISEEELKQKMFHNIENAQKPRLWLTYKHVIKIAAVLMVFAVTAAIYMRLDKPAVQQVVHNHAKEEHDYTTDNNHQVVLTLANGSKMVLNQLGQNVVAKCGNTLVQQDKDGAFIHGVGEQVESSLQMNTVSTPTGEKFHIKLPDGTGVWLNALSSLKFPAVFADAQRVVELNGEAYFEVAKDNERPFIVNTAKGASIKVLGTHFDVMAYDDEEGVNTTLLEGSVKVEKGDLSQLIKPGQKAAANKSISVTNVDVQQAIAWKNDLFSFDGAGTREVMRQVGRWYGVKIVYNKAVHDRQLTGYVSRTSTLPDVLKMLELSGMNFLVKDKIIEVLN